MASEAGIVQVVVVRARNLKPMDTLGNADPFVVLSCSSNPQQKQKTDKVKSSVAPTWDSSFTFDTPTDDTGVTITAEVYDWDRFTSNEPMGCVVISAANLNMEGKEKWYSLAPMPGCEDPQVRCTPSNGHKAVDLATNKPQFTAQGEILLRCAATFPAAQRQQQLASRRLAAESALAVSTLSAGQAELLGGCGGNNSTLSALILSARRLGQERRGGGRACRKASAAGDGRGGGYGKSISSLTW